MIPILFPSSATDFTTNGLGRLSDAITCKVIEERNGEYELQMRYPTSGNLYSKIQNEAIIVATPFYGGSKQAFRIYNIESDSKYTCTIRARHLSYDASYIPIRPFTAAGIDETIATLNSRDPYINPRGSTELITYSDDELFEKYRFRLDYATRYTFENDQMQALITFTLYFERDEDAQLVHPTSAVPIIVINGTRVGTWSTIPVFNDYKLSSTALVVEDYLIYDGPVPAEGALFEPSTITARILMAIEEDEETPYESDTSSGTLQLNPVGRYSVNLESNPFTIDTDIVNTETPYTQLYPRSLRECLGGDEGSLLDRFASRGTGEYEWDNYSIHFWEHRGADNGYKCLYGKNIVTLDREIDSEKLITGVVGTWEDPETGVYLYSDVQYADNKSDFAVNKTVVVDFSEDFNSTPTPSQLNAAAKIYADTQCILDDSIDLEFYDQNNQAVSLCDTITVKFEKIGVDVKVKVIKTIWDVLLERYDKITIGSLRSTLADTIYDQLQNVASIAARYTDNSLTAVRIVIDEDLGVVRSTIERVDSNVSDLGSDINDRFENEETGVLKQISDISQSYDTISATVSRIIEKDGIIDQAITTSQEQFAEYWELSTLKQSVSEDGQYIEEQKSYLQWNGSDASLTIGRSDSNVKTRTSNEGYQVLVGGEVSWQADADGSRNKKYMQAGRYKFVDEGTNGFSLIYE